jgi:hypothetical protein
MSQFLIAHIGHTRRQNEHVCWWKPDSKGYTICIDKAGLFSEDEARSICQHGECIAVRVQAVEPLARSTPYYRQSGGKLGKLYDGGPNRPVENEDQAWRHLLNKARSIYLDGLEGGAA